MMSEYCIAWSYLRDGGLLPSDDVKSNDAFLDFADKVNIKPTIFGRMGVIRKTRSFYDKNYFERYGGTGYTPETAYWHLRPFATSISSLVKFYVRRKPSVRALDIGCAKGYLVKMLREGGIEALGVDVSEYTVNNALDDVKPYLHKVDVENEFLPFQHKFFDLIISHSTFEHLRLRRMPFILSEIHRVLKLGGLLIINVPSPLNKAEAEKPEHITMLSRKEWIKLIENLGFHYDSKLSRLFTNMNVKEIATLYILSHHSFQFMRKNFYFPKEMKTLAPYLIMLKRKLFAPNFSLIFNRSHSCHSRT